MAAVAGPKGWMLNALGLIARLREATRLMVAGSDPNACSGKHVVYVHYDATGDVAEYVLLQLREYAALGFRITFVSNSPGIKQSKIKILASLCRLVINRQNVGYDFAAYRQGISSIRGYADCSCLILTNDSVYGPLFPLSEILSRCGADINDMWGATDSEEIAYHVQSYFLLFHAKALQSNAFRRFWRWYPNITDREWVIKNGEISLSHRLKSAGLRIGAVFRCEDAEIRRQWTVEATRKLPRTLQTERFIEIISNPDRKASTFNPTHFYWEELVLVERYPFLKRSLIRNDDWNFSFAFPWKEIIASHTSYDCSLIELHLTRRGD